MSGPKHPELIIPAAGTVNLFHPGEGVFVTARNCLPDLDRMYLPDNSGGILFYFFRALRPVFFYEDRNLARLGFFLRGAFDFLRGLCGPVPALQRKTDV